jgi:hypothetical protein
MNGQSEGFGLYLRSLPIAYRRAGILKWLLMGGWLLYPVIVQTLLHASDAAGLAYYLGGHYIPRVFGSGDFIRGVILTLVVLALLTWAQLTLVVLFYRRTSLPIPLWPVAFFLVGAIANSVWWFEKGFFDLEGALAGMIPVVVMVGSQKLCERLGHDFVFGGGRRPDPDPLW